MGEALELEIEPHAEGLVDALRTLREFVERARLAERPAYVVLLVAEEILTNVVKYADGFERIGLRVVREPGSVTLRFEDAGPPFDPTGPREPSDVVCEGGRGVALVQRMADALEYRREGERNVLVVTVRTSP